MIADGDSLSIETTLAGSGALAFMRKAKAAEFRRVRDRAIAGQVESSIGRRFDRESSSVFLVLSRSGGIRPAERRHSARALSLAEREEVSRGLVAGRSLRAIASQLGRAPSTISREVGRNGGRDRYRATASDQAARERALRPKSCKLACHPGLRRTVSAKLRRKWSPEQIAGWLGRRFADQEQHRVSHETIYKSLYIQARGVLKEELLEHLRAKRTIRRSRHASLKHDGLGQIRDAVPISERPPCVEDRTVPGHWEGDLISGARGSHVVTLVERQSRYVILAKVANKQTATIVSALIEQARKLPGDRCQSLTWDRGKELADHRRFTLATDVEVYSAIRTARGSAVPMRTPTAYCASTCPMASTCRPLAKLSSALSPGSSTNDPEKP